MSSLLGNEEYRVMQCPACGKYISGASISCGNCSAPITDDLRKAAVARQDKAVRDTQISFYKNIMIAGIAVFGIGVAMLTVSIVSVYSHAGRFFIWSPIITLVGLGQIIYSLHGIYKEKNYKN